MMPTEPFKYASTLAREMPNVFAISTSAEPSAAIFFSLATPASSKAGLRPLYSFLVLAIKLPSRWRSLISARSNWPTASDDKEEFHYFEPTAPEPTLTVVIRQCW